MKRLGAEPLSHTEKCRRVRAKRRAKGQCWYCVQPIAPGSAGTCATHLQKKREAGRQHKDCGVWKPGSVGRPPLWSQSSEASAA